MTHFLGHVLSKIISDNIRSIETMPKKVIDYSKAQIYKLVCRDVNITDCYVGSTTNFAKRKNGHKTSCTNVRGCEYAQPVYEFIRRHGDWANWDMILIENFPCASKQELLLRERHHMEVLKSTLNRRIAIRTKQERTEKVAVLGNTPDDAINRNSWMRACYPDDPVFTTRYYQ